MNHISSSSADIGQTAFFTGHRYIPADRTGLIAERIYSSISNAYFSGYRKFYCGCALGFDTIAAFQTVKLRKQYPDVILSLAVPCATQPDRWSERDKEQYNTIIALADECVILSPVYYQGVMLTRNRYMADRSSLCICYLTHMRGGTASTVRYALTLEPMNIVNLAVSDDCQKDLLRENTWNYMYISPSANKNAVTAPLRLIRHRKLSMKNIPISF